MNFSSPESGTLRALARARAGVRSAVQSSSFPAWTAKASHYSHRGGRVSQEPASARLGEPKLTKRKISGGWGWANCPPALRCLCSSCAILFPGSLEGAQLLASSRECQGNTNDKDAVQRRRWVRNGLLLAVPATVQIRGQIVLWRPKV